MDDRKAHWNKVYSTKSSDKLSWTQQVPSPSLDLILEEVPDRNAAIIDVGGGTSLLAEYLNEAGYVTPAVLDISVSALNQTRTRLGENQSKVEWIEADVTTFVSSRRYFLWHDRAVFHFLMNRLDRERYVQTLLKTLEPQGKVILGVFSLDGPSQCSGLDVARFNETALVSELGSSFRLLRSLHQTHQTPWGVPQEFLYGVFQRVN